MNNEWEKEFDRRTNSRNYEKDGYEIKEGQDDLLDPTWYPESAYEMDGDKIKSFIATLLKRERERALDIAWEYCVDALRKESASKEELRERLFPTKTDKQEDYKE